MPAMKIGLFAALALLAAGSIGTTALAASGHSGHNGMHHGMKMHGGGWMSSLDEQQREQIDKLHLRHKQQSYLIKAKIKQVRVELALLVSDDKPEQGAIDKKIDELVSLKRDKLEQRAKHHIRIRKLLNEAQRVSFDMHLLMNAKKGKRGHHGK